MALVLRTCNKDLTSFNGFQWPQSGYVECPDWDPTPTCGRGLHGLLWGEGNGGLLSWEKDVRWLVVLVDDELIVPIDDKKVKFPKGEVVFCGDRKGATDYLLAHGGAGKTIVGAFVTVGDCLTATSGDGGTSTSGNYGTSTSGNYGNSISGSYGTSISRYSGTSTSGAGGTSTSSAGGNSISGYNGTSTSGDCGNSTSGDYGNSISGDHGTSISGDYGTSTSGNYGTSISGNYGTSTSGEKGCIQIWYWNGMHRRLAVGYIGENGLEPNVPYKLNKDHEFVRKT